MSTKQEDKIVRNMPTEMKDKDKWYGDAKDYWKEIPATVDGMLGGFSHISTIDIAWSRKFLLQFLEPPAKRTKSSSVRPQTQARIALDCGAGIGRVTKHLLIPLFETVEMLEQNKGFLDQCDQYLGDLRSKVKNLYPIGLQEFDPEPGRYDLIWCQWVVGHLTDDDFIIFLNKCKKGLSGGGILCLKENIATVQDYDVDVVDSSVTRSHKQYMKLFNKSKMRLIRKDTQTDFPSEIYKVNLYALVPDSKTDEKKQETD